MSNYPTNVLFYLEEACCRFANKAAIRMNDEQLTFAELAEKSRALGVVIAKKGIKGSPIPVLAERNIYTPVLFFATLYSGNYYIPIDPDMPKNKIHSIFVDSACQIALAAHRSQNINPAFGEFAGLMTLDDAGDNTELSLCALEALPLYMVYTSGSTGVPKGVLKNHKAEISFVEAYCRTFDFSENDVIGNQTPFYFDASGKDLYLMLKTGATLDIIPQELFMKPLDLITYLDEHKVTFISWVPSALVVVSKLGVLSIRKPTTLQKVFFVGEVMPIKHLKNWREALPEVQFVNLYGSSEIAGIACYQEVIGALEDSAILPVGKPLDNCKIYLLNEGQVVTEMGKTGEIFIVSEALAEGYFNDDVRTQEHFVTREFIGSRPERCFKSGDLAKYNEKGELVFVSRNDFQIKHMGYRIELGDIESTAEQIADVQRACCTYDREKARLTLYCELDKSSDLTKHDIMSKLRGMLSSYMQPNKVVLVENMPLTSNGKIDRRFLNAL